LFYVLLAGKNYISKIDFYNSNFQLAYR